MPDVALTLVTLTFTNFTGNLELTTATSGMVLTLSNGNLVIQGNVTLGASGVSVSPHFFQLSLSAATTTVNFELKVPPTGGMFSVGGSFASGTVQGNTSGSGGGPTTLTPGTPWPIVVSATVDD